MTADNQPSVKPRLLDLFCKAGGATKGYQLAGFYVVGVDWEPQPNYCGDEFHQADALTYDLAGSMPSTHRRHARPGAEPPRGAATGRHIRNSLAPIRRRLLASGLPYVIENVQDARFDLRSPIILCGSQFAVPVRSHRYFEIMPTPFALMPPCHHRPGGASRDHGAKQTEAAFRDAMGCDWMSVHEARQAIPPAYTEWIGRQLVAMLERAA